MERSPSINGGRPKPWLPATYMDACESASVTPTYDDVDLSPAVEYQSEDNDDQSDVMTESDDDDSASTDASHMNEDDEDDDCDDDDNDDDSSYTSDMADDDDDEEDDGNLSFADDSDADDDVDVPSGSVLCKKLFSLTRVRADGRAQKNAIQALNAIKEWSKCGHDDEDGNPAFLELLVRCGGIPKLLTFLSPKWRTLKAYQSQPAYLLNWEGWTRMATMS
jgi:hypothetical protein